MSRKIKRLPFDDFVMVQGLSKETFALIFSQLPKDARVVGFGRETMTAESYVYIQSDSYPDLKEWEDIEDLNLWLRAPKFPGPIDMTDRDEDCTCDLKYTGLKLHNKGCPQYG